MFLVASKYLMKYKINGATVLAITSVSGGRFSVGENYFDAKSDFKKRYTAYKKDGASERFGFDERKNKTSDSDGLLVADFD